MLLCLRCYNTLLFFRQFVMKPIYCDAYHDYNIFVIAHKPTVYAVYAKFIRHHVVT